MDIFDNYSTGLELGYETHLVDDIDDPKDPYYVGESATLHVKDPFAGDQNDDGSSFYLTIWLEDNSVSLSFNLYAVGGVEPQITIEVDLDTGEPIMEYNADRGGDDDENIGELPSVLDRIKRLSRVRGSILGLVNFDDDEEGLEDADEKGE